ncbi:uncharacterized protein LOC121048176 [Ixodes scapularis]|nr:uncharacterized protein LOC121048176 [Ixodes scapularis]
MGRERTNRARKFFNYDSVSNKSTCQIEDCQHVVSGDHGGNLERHLQRRHKEVYGKLLAEKATKRVVLGRDEDSPAAKLRQVDITSMLQPTSSKCVWLEITEDSIMKSCVELVTRNGRPFRLVDDSGFRQIIDPVLKALGARRAITAATVKDRVQEEAKSKREEISSSLRGRMFSLKIDCASRLDRALLGINVQYAENGRLVLQPLAMKELFDRHTGEHLRLQVKSTLSRYDLSISQVYSVTTDNGANMLKAVRLLGEADDESDDCSSDEEADSGEHAFGTYGLISLLDNPEVTHLPGLDDADLMLGVRCAAHTLQLAVTDALKESGSCTIVAECRALVKKLRVQSAMGLIRKLGLKKPVIDCPTRWMSTLNMLVRLTELKSFVEDFLSEEERSRWIECMWAEVEMLTVALEPAQVATKKLQREQLTIGDFYDAWLTCVLSTSKILSPLAKALVKFMKKRERDLCDTNIFCGALYMEPRYRLLLTTEQKCQARLHLSKTWKRITGLQPKQDIKYIQASVAAAPAEPQDALEALLKEKEAEAGAHPEAGGLGPVDIACLLEMLDKEARLPRTTNVLAFWEERKERQPELYSLAKVALGVPATQVSVERAFSALKFILSDQRSCLSLSTLDDVLFLRSCSVP